MKLSDPVEYIKGVGPKNAKALGGLGIYTVEDLFDYWPRKYDDYSQAKTIDSLKPGLVMVKGIFGSVTSRYARRGLHITRAVLKDKSGSVAVTWFNQPYRAAALKNDVEYFVIGDYSLKAGRLQITNPSVQLASEVPTHNSIVPTYRESKHVNSHLIRKLIGASKAYFSIVPESLPEWLIQTRKLLSRSEALKTLHMPSTLADLEQANSRFAFEELFYMQLSGQLVRQALELERAPVIKFDEALARNFVAKIPFELTADQKRSIWQVYKDMSHDRPMNRLVEGDVGSGKTVVAAMSALMVLNQGMQVLFMAPTEILARQHAATLTKLFGHTAWADQVGLLVGALSPKQKSEMHAKISNGEVKLVVGTSALLQDKVVTRNVGLVIIDEQHRFGVEQRNKLKTKTGEFPHILCMTATPIPRSLALTLYGELDITQLKSMPSGRSPIETQIVNPSSRKVVHDRILKAVAEGRQAFFVVPSIEDNPDSPTVSAIEHHKKLAKVFSKLHVGLLHGKMKPVEKDAIMQSFKDGAIQVLVSTTVIEVGVDVPNATIMVVESAERFGLAQIHQLRGRVGRGQHPGECYLIPSEDNLIPKRLRALCQITDGFKLSELDLELRGPGAIYGVRQSGVLDLRIATFGDTKMITDAKQAAMEFVERGENVVHYPQVAAKVAHFRSIQRLN